MVVRQALTRVSNSPTVGTAANVNPIAKSVAKRFVAGTEVADAVRVAAELAGSGLHCALSYLGPEVADAKGADETVTSNLRLLDALHSADLADRVELSIKPSDLGLIYGDDLDKIFQRLSKVAAAADQLHARVVLDMEQANTVDPTLELASRARLEFPQTGVTVQANLRRTENDCEDLAAIGARVRLVKGAFEEPESTAFAHAQEIDRSYVRCLKALMLGTGTPLIATHDPRLIEIASALAVRSSRERGSYELQMLYGVRPAEQKRLAASGEKVRVFVPYGPRWYPYLMRRMAEKPANLRLFATALSRRG